MKIDIIWSVLLKVLSEKIHDEILTKIILLKLDFR